MDIGFLTLAYGRNVSKWPIMGNGCSGAITSRGPLKDIAAVKAHPGVLC